MKREHTGRILASTFGEQLNELQVDQSACFSLLKSSNWEHRFWGLHLLHEHWKLPADVLIPLCKSTIVTDALMHINRFEAVPLI
jgi:hypothetical protein